MNIPTPTRKAATFPEKGLVRLSSILAPAGPIPVSRSGWWAGVRSGRYPKPIKLGIFLARMRALIRRGPAAPSAPLLQLGNIQLNRLTHTLSCDGRPCAATRMELGVIEYFLLRPGTLVTRTELMHDVWGLAFDTGTNLVDVQMSRVRRVLRDAGASLEFVTVRGQGFVLQPRHDP